MASRFAKSHTDDAYDTYDLELGMFCFQELDGVREDLQAARRQHVRSRMLLSAITVKGIWAASEQTGCCPHN